MRCAVSPALLAAVLVALASVAGAQPLVVKAGRVYTVSGEVIANGAVVIDGGKITAVGKAGVVPVPKGARTLEAAVATPGLIDAQTSVGLAGFYNVGADRDANEKTGPNQSALRALDAFNPDDPLLDHLLAHGVTLINTGPGPADPLAGQSGVFRTHGEVADEMAVKVPSALVVNLGEIPKATYGKREKLPSTRMGTAAVLRQSFLAGMEYERLRAAGGASKPDRDLAKETLGLVSRGRLPVILVAQRADDIVTALRIGREFNLRMALAGAAEGYLVRDRIRESGAPVLVGPVTQRVASPETFNASYENAALLADDRIRIAIRSGFDGYVPRAHIVLYEAAVAAANGLGFDAALRAITLAPAEILGIDDRFGSLEVGKSGDVVLFDGDPFEYTSHVEVVVVEGEPVYRRTPGAP